jgi:dihydrofolate reductase
MTRATFQLERSARDAALIASSGLKGWKTAVRKLAITQNITVDGAIEMLDDWFDPQGQAQIDNTDLLEEVHRQDAQSDAFLVGRQTFQDLRGYWSTLSVDPTGIADYLNAVAKYVVSNTLIDPQWQHTTVLSGDPVAQVRTLKDAPGRDIVLTGSITLCHALIKAGLVDEYRLFVYPVVQGRGRRLFPDGLRVPRLQLVDAKVFRGGVTYSCYVPA